MSRHPRHYAVPQWLRVGAITARSGAIQFRVNGPIRGTELGALAHSAFAHPIELHGRRDTATY
jgi:hypothetical protein